jgi:DNA uptake protein ComE-like DNA-binding protein
MKLSITFTISVITAVSAFTPSTNNGRRGDVKLNIATRRDILYGIAAVTTGFAGVAQPVFALNSIPADNEIVKEQRTVVEKLDINNAAVADYMQFPGMYPTIAGKISNNGPYASLNDVYKLKVLSKAEVSKIKEYAKEFAATPSTGLDTMRGRDPYRRSFNK